MTQILQEGYSRSVWELQKQWSARTAAWRGQAVLKGLSFADLVRSVPDICFHFRLVRPTFSRTSSAASCGSRSGFPSANRNSKLIFFPSVHPSLRSSCRNASTRTAIPDGVLESRKPIRKIFAVCCAVADEQSAKNTPLNEMEKILPHHRCLIFT